MVAVAKALFAYAYAIVARQNPVGILLRYRPEIDGLRAVAIIPAVFYHAGFGVGFASIVIFFVISGYLITTIILKDLIDDKFSLVDFYERRVRRILPAMFFVMLVCLPFAWFWLMPADFRQFSRSVIGVATFTNNLVLLSESGYFEAEVTLKPLMAMWSLAVEEQYYIIFPLLLILIWRFAKHLIVPALVIIFLCSLGYAEWSARNEPGAAYFILQTRIWELLAGAFAAIYLINRSEKPTASGIDQTFSLLGLLLIIYSLLMFDKGMIWPGLYALIPVGGAILIILFAGNGTFVNWLLSNRFFVGIGLISYSVYLWHQPIFAFYRHIALGQTSTPVYLLLILLSYLLAILSYRYIETPVRRRNGMVSQKGVFIIALVAALFFIAVGSYAPALAKKYALDAEQTAYLGFFDNLRPKMKYMEREGVNDAFRHECNFYDYEKYRYGKPTQIPVAELAKECIQRDQSKPYSLLLWGDSHAQMLRYGLDKNIPADWQILQIATSNCSPRIGRTDSEIDFCERSNWAAWKLVKELSPDVVLIAQNDGHDAELFSEMAAELRSAGVERIIFVGPSAHWRFYLPTIITRRLFDDTPRYTRLGLNEDAIETDAKVAAASRSQSTFEYVSMIDYFCNADGCLTYIGDDRMRGITTWDYGHLTLPASDKFGKDVLVKKLISNTNQ
jgi:peptidoglycan/LPS O-acetylase OafA/YrhL